MNTSLRTTMKTGTRVLSLFAFCATAGLANAQLSEAYVSGLLHTATGGATLGPVDGRRLTVRNIGSSGEDGVSIRMHSSSGGGAEIDIAQILQTPGAILTNKHKKWDGVINYVHRMISNGDNTALSIYDFTGSGATSVRVDEYDEAGGLTGSTIYPGPIAQRPFVPNWTCPFGGTPEYYAKWVTLCNSCNPVLVEGWYCVTSNGDNTGEYSNNRIIVTPELPSTGLPPGGTESMILTATGVSDLDVSYAHIGTFDALSSGTGTAHLAEVCTSSTGECTPATAKLVASNIGSSGQDGVEVKWRRTAQSSSGDVTLGDMIYSTGLATLHKSGFLAGSSQEIELTSLTVKGLSDQAYVAPDFSGMGATEYLVTGYLNGAIVQQTVEPNGGGIILTTDQIVCGPNSTVVYGWITWYDYQCQCLTTFWGVTGCIYGSWGGGSPTYMDRIVFSPINPIPMGGDAALSVAGRDLTNPIEISNVQWTKLCPADFNDDGFLTGEDFDAYVSAFETGGIDADYNGDGFVTGEDFDAFVAAFEIGC